MAEKVQLSLVSGMHLQAVAPGYEGIIPLDSDESVGGQGLGFRPLPMLLVGLAGCMSMDAVSILRKKRQVFDLFDVSVDVEQQTDEHPHVFTKVHLHFRAGGENVSAEALARALELSYTKYCPAAAMLKTGTGISYSYEIVPQQVAVE